jgi:hypothetical protein
MLNTLDTVIAFAVIMTVLGLFMTLIVQMVSPTLSLRGLANGLRLTFQTIDPVLPNTRTPSPLKLTRSNFQRFTLAA